MDGVTVTPKASPAPVAQSYSVDHIRPIAGLVGLDVHAISDGDGKALQAIYDYARGETAEMTELELLHNVRSLEQRLGLPGLGERRVDKLYRYVKIQRQIDGLTKRRDMELR